MEDNESIIKAVQSVFSRANFINHLGIKLTNAGRGWCETSLICKPEHKQQHGFIHAGVITTLADHTAGGAARSVVPEQDVLTVEFKINFLAPAIGERLVARGEVLRAGRKIIVVEAEVFSIQDRERVRVAKLTSTLTVAPTFGG